MGLTVYQQPQCYLNEYFPSNGYWPEVGGLFCRFEKLVQSNDTVAGALFCSGALMITLLLREVITPKNPNCSCNSEWKVKNLSRFALQTYLGTAAVVNSLENKRLSNNIYTIMAVSASILLLSSNVGRFANELMNRQVEITSSINSLREDISNLAGLVTASRGPPPEYSPAAAPEPGTTSQ